MLITAPNSGQVINFSFWRIFAIELFIAALAGLPLARGFGDGLRYTGFFYQPGIYPILIVSSAFLGLIFLALLPLLWRALQRFPAIEFFEDSIRVYGAFGRTVRKSAIQEIIGPKFGNLTVKVTGERDVTLPLFLYEKPSRELGRIKDALE